MEPDKNHWENISPFAASKDDPMPRRLEGPTEAGSFGNFGL
jgi:hypothetical protein